MIAVALGHSFVRYMIALWPEATGSVRAMVALASGGVAKELLFFSGGFGGAGRRHDHPTETHHPS